MNINRTDGWVKIHRNMLTSDLLQDQNACLVFIAMLAMAHNEDNQGSVRINGKQVYLKKGDFVISQRELANMLLMPRGTVRHAIERLIEAQRLAHHSDQHKSIYSICNWSKYQGAEDTKKGKSRPTSRPTTGPPLAHQPLSQKKERNKENSTNVLLAKPGNEEINKLFDYWRQSVGYPITSKVTQNRRAAYNLHRKYQDDVYKLIDGVSLAQGERFAPQISDFAELQAKLNNLLAWGKKRTSAGMEVIT